MKYMYLSISRNYFCPQDSLTEMTPEGHVYYLLDPLDPTGSGLEETASANHTSNPVPQPMENHTQAKELGKKRSSSKSKPKPAPKPVLPDRRSNSKSGKKPKS